MSARNYMPYIEGAMDHIQRIYDFNQKVDEMRLEPHKPIITTHDSGLKTVDTLAGYLSIEDMYKASLYSFNNGLRMYYEERHEYTTARLAGDKLEAVDAIVDQFVVAIGEIRKCALSDDYEKIYFWEEKASKAHDDLYDTFWDINDSIDSAHIKRDKAFTVVIDALFTRFGDDAYIDENGKFIKSKGYTKPDLSFLLK